MCITLSNGKKLNTNIYDYNSKKSSVYIHTMNEEKLVQETCMLFSIKEVRLMTHYAFKKDWKCWSFYIFKIFKQMIDFMVYVWLADVKLVCLSKEWSVKWLHKIDFATVILLRKLTTVLREFKKNMKNGLEL